MILRITFKENDYNFQVVNSSPITKTTVEIPILLQGQSLVLLKGSKGWALSEPNDSVDPDLIAAIGRAIELRYRL